MKLSICIPTYNRAEVFDLIKAIDGYFSSDVSVLISDNCSTLYTKQEFIELVTAINPSYQCIYQPANTGYAGNIINLINLVDTEWMTFIMSDDSILFSNLNHVFNNIRPDDQIIFSNGRSRLLSTRKFSHTINAFLSFSRFIQILIFRCIIGSFQAFPYVPVSRFNFLWSIFCFLPFPALPNSLIVRTDLIKSVIKSDIFLSVYEEIKDTGHDLDLLLLILCSNKAQRVKVNFKPTYVLRKHLANEQTKIKKNRLYHYEVDRFAIRSLIPSSTFLRCSILLRFPSVVLATLKSSGLSQVKVLLRFLFRESFMVVSGRNNKPVMKL